MSTREQYTPSPRSAKIHKEGDAWTLVLVRDLSHPPEKVWAALTDPAQIREWAPYEADRDLGTPGPAKLTTVGTPYAADTQVKADRQKALEFNWNGKLRWELEPTKTGTRLTLWANIDKRYIAMGAAGWHICLDVLDHLLAGDPMGRIAGPEAMKFAPWQKLHGEYAKDFGATP